MDFNLQVNDSAASKKAHVAETAGSVFQDYVGGMYDELKNQPTKLLTEAAVGAAVGVGALTLNPQIRAVVAIAGSVAALAEIGSGAKNLADQTSIINNFDGTKSATEIAAAHTKVGEMGASAMNFAATAAGGSLGFEGARISTGFAGLVSPFPFVTGLQVRPAVFDAALITDARKLLFEKP